jgi:hypothetical protein
MALQKRPLKRIKPREKTTQEKVEIIRRKLSVPLEIKDVNQIKKINLVFEETKSLINKLREIKDPVKEKELRHKIFLEFEKKMKALGSSLSFQKIKGSEKSAADKFYTLIARDYYNHTTKAMTSAKIGNLMVQIKRKLKSPLHPKKIKEYMERCYYESMFFIQGEAVENSFKRLEIRLGDIPSEIKTTVANFLVKEYMAGYDKQVKEYRDTKKVESDIVANAYANLAIRISFLEML